MSLPPISALQAMPLPNQVEPLERLGKAIGLGDTTAILK